MTVGLTKPLITADQASDYWVPKKTEMSIVARKNSPCSFNFLVTIYLLSVMDNEFLRILFER